MIVGRIRPKILLIEADAAAAELVLAALADSQTCTFTVERVSLLSQGIAKLGEKGIAAVLLNLSLPDSQGLGALDKLLCIAPDIPILVLGGPDDESLAKQAVERGAQDYLLPDHVDCYSLPRALRNSIERKYIEDALFVEKERAQVTLNSIGDAVLCTDASGNISYLNQVAEVMTGWGHHEAVGRPLREIFRILDGISRKPAEDPMQMAIDQNRTVGLTANCILLRRDGFEHAIEDSAAPIRDRNGCATGAVIVFHDVSAARAMSLEMTRAAQHDALTGLPNRMLLNDRISQAIASARRHRCRLAVVFVDLDRFKNVNDSLGHPIGDKLLQSVSNRLVTGVRNSDTVSRQGGDEFVVLLAEITSSESAGTTAEKLLQSLSAPHFVESHELHIDCSIGVSIFPEDGQDAAMLIKNADIAMYHAKEKGRNNVQFFKTEMNTKAVDRQFIEVGLRRAIEQNEFLLHYQPKVNLRTGEITGVEALLRWQQHERGLVPPAQFVPIAEDCGLILQIGRWVLREACKQAREWRDAGLPRPVAVNVSASEFRDKAFLEGLKTILEETGLEACQLELELTESVLMQHAESSTAVLKELKNMGVNLTLDDFGTGYSSLSYLRHFPIDVLKIDQSFVDQITSDPHASAIVSAVIGMGKGLNQRVVAEGVETRQQLEFLQAQHCGEGQGYLFSRPLAAAPFAKLLETGVAETVVH
jgi:diguanylate cyclase (GGDEF)-like protein/PAS domain S-box-containing protein